MPTLLESSGGGISQLRGAKTTSDTPSEFAPRKSSRPADCSQDSGHGPLNIGCIMDGGPVEVKCSKKTQESRFDRAGASTFPTGPRKPLQ